jgi:hypothetical protein
MKVEASPKGRARGRAEQTARRGRGRKALPMIRTSERLVFNMCRFKWNLEFNSRIKPTTAAPALRFGTLVHAALAAWYIPGVKRGEHPAISFERLYNKELKTQTKMGFRDDDGTWHEAGQLGVAMLENYVDTYGKDEVWEVLVTEQPFRVIVEHEVRIDKWPHSRKEPWFEYVGVLDGVWRHRGNKKLWIPDHKTTAGIGNTTAQHLVLDDQAGAYWSWGVDWLYTNGYLQPKQKLAGMLYNFLRKAMPDERERNAKGQYLNKDGSVSAKQPSPYFLRQPIFRDEIDRQAARTRALLDKEEMELVQQGVLTAKKSPSMLHCRGCWALDICEMHEAGHDWEELQEATTQSWDPYAEHAIYEGR